ncbi:uncharacterized protein LOC125368112 [Perognathus longimembris pacificus]|uniref:uncharacterized protein LOC125368112 n=1 Tax=Perognathus longimembris pacificus TaxID=214514 RepID=UPI002019139F|nr:uncharacterized protein LOC125368112 [Perognathus longimembris pacificus]
MWLLLLLFLEVEGWQYTLQVKRQVTVQEGLCVHVPCHFSYPWESRRDRIPVRGYWYKLGTTLSLSILVATNDPDRQVQEENKGRFHLLGDPKSNNCSLDIRNARAKDKGEYFFRLERGNLNYSYIENRLFLRVRALTPNILIPGTLEASRPSNVTCSVPWACEQGTPPIFSWRGASVSSLSPKDTQSAVLTFTPRPQDHGTNLTCQVTLPTTNVTTRTAVQLSVLYAPQNLTLSVSEGASSAPEALRNGSSISVLEGQALRLLCATDGYPTARLSWSWGNLSLCPTQPSDPGMLELSPVNLQRGGEFTCRAENTLGARHVSLTISPQSKAGSLTGVMLGAVGGAGVVTLLFLVICLLFVLVRSYRRKSAKPAAATAGVGAPSTGPNPGRAKHAVGVASQSPMAKSQAEDSPPCQPPEVSSAEEDEAYNVEPDDIHYATLSFQEMKPKEPRGQTWAMESEQAKVEWGNKGKPQLPAPTSLAPSQGLSASVMLWLRLLPLMWVLKQAPGEGPEKPSQADGHVLSRRFRTKKYTLHVSGSVTVQEGLCVLVPCTFFHSGFQGSTNQIFGYWFRDKTDDRNGVPVATSDPDRNVDVDTFDRFHLVGDPQDNNCSLGIRDVKRRDTGKYFFRIQGESVKHSYKNNQLSLQVTALTEAPVIDMPETLQSGRRSNITCAVPWACEQGTPPVFSWRSSSTMVLDSAASSSPVLPITPKLEDHGTTLTCQVTFPGVEVMVERTVQLNVSYAPQNLTISVSRGARTGFQTLANGSSLEVEEGESLWLMCVVTASHPPATLLWAPVDLTLGPSQNSSQKTLLLARAQAEDSGEYVCRAEHPLGMRDTSVVLIVKSPLWLLGPSCSWGAEGLHCTCASHAWPAPSLQWRLGEALLEGDSSNASITVTSSSAGSWANSSLSLREGLSSSLRLSCEAQNVHRAQNAPVLLLLGPEGNPGGWTRMVQGAIMGAGVTALLAVSLCLIFFIRPAGGSQWRRLGLRMGLILQGAPSWVT